MGEAKECSEEDLVKALELARDAVRTQIKAQHDLRDKKGVTGKRDYTKPEQNDTIKQRLLISVKTGFLRFQGKVLPKGERSEAFGALKDLLISSLGEEATDSDKNWLRNISRPSMGTCTQHDPRRSYLCLDGRKLDEIRSLTMEVDPLPTPHGSALFTRGETQSITTVTLGTPPTRRIVGLKVQLSPTIPNYPAL